jgi:hypothetical protein
MDGQSRIDIPNYGLAADLVNAGYGWESALIVDGTGLRWLHGRDYAPAGASALFGLAQSAI